MSGFTSVIHCATGLANIWMTDQSIFLLNRSVPSIIHQGSFCEYAQSLRRRYTVTWSLIGWAHTQNDPWFMEQNQYWLVEEMHTTDLRSKIGISHYAMILMELLGCNLYGSNAMSEISPWSDLHKTILIDTNQDKGSPFQTPFFSLIDIQWTFWFPPIQNIKKWSLQRFT